MYLKKFLEIHAVDYQSLPHSGEHESETDLSAKNAWLDAGVEALKELALSLGDVSCDITTNRSGSIDRGYVTGFISMNDKTVYISLNDGSNDILFRTAERIGDYTGGRNNTIVLNGYGWEYMTEWVKNTLA